MSTVNIDIELLKENLKQKGYKLTPQRRAIVDVIIEKEGEHLTAEEIYDEVKKICPDIGLATVYRTMQLLDEIGAISKLNLDDGCIRYEIDLDNEGHNHHHLVCKNCGKIIGVEEDLLKDIEMKIQENYKFHVVNHDLKFDGYCEDCYREMKKDK